MEETAGSLIVDYHVRVVPNKGHALEHTFRSAGTMAMAADMWRNAVVDCQWLEHDRPVHPGDTVLLIEEWKDGTERIAACAIAGSVAINRNVGHRT